MKIERVGVWWNRDKRDAPMVAARLVHALETRGVGVCLDPSLALRLGRPENAAGQDGFRDCDLLAILGGDGTLLSALETAIPHSLPMVGINLGHMGFLCEIEPDEIDQDVDRLLKGQFTLEHRMLLEARAPGEAPMPALNDVVFSRSAGSMRILTTEVYLGGILVDRFSGDGLILSSPTGSTAYSFSAGGPVVAPGMDLIVMTPICPHTLHTRPFVLPADSQLDIRVSSDAPAQMSIDGRNVCLIPPDHWVRVCRGPDGARFVRLHDRSFFDLLRGKLTDWNR